MMSGLALYELPVSTLFSFAATSLIIELTPGPNMAYLAVIAASDGRRSGFATVAGITLGLAVVGLAASLGLAEIVTQSPGLYAALRWAGIVFLLYLAVDAWRDSSTEVGPVAEPASKHFARGLMTNLLNPKAAVFYIAVLPTFLDDVSPTLGQTLVLTTIYLLVATAIHCAIVILAGSLGAVLNEPSRERFIRRFLAIVLAVVAVWFAWTTRK